MKSTWTFARELKKCRRENDSDTNCTWHTQYSHQRLIKELGNKKTSEDHPNYCIVEIGQNTEESPGDLRRFAVTQTLVEKHQLRLMWKILKYPADHWVELKESEKKDKYFDLYWELKNCESDVDTNSNWRSWYSH